MRKRISTVFVTFLFSNLLVLLVPIVIGSFAYFQVERLLSDDASASELRMLKEIRRVLDSELSDIRTMSWRISSNSRISRFLEVGRSRTPQDRLEGYYVEQELRPYGTGRSLLWDYFVYFKNSDLVITPSSVAEPDVFFGGICVANPDDPMEFYRYLRGFNGYFRSLPARTFRDLDSRRDLIAVVQSLPSTRFYEPAALLVALIDASRLSGMIDAAYRGGYVCILDDHDNVILEKGKLPPAVKLPPAESSGAGPDGFRFENHHVVSFTRTDDSMFRLYSVISEDTYLRTLNGYRNLIVAVLAACLLVGLAIATLLARRNSRPLRQLVDTLIGTYGEKPDAADGDLGFIRDAVVEAFRANRQLKDGYENIIKENRQYRDRLNENTLLVRNGLLTRLILGNLGPGESLVDWLRLNGVRFRHARFQVLLFHVDNHTELLQGGRLGDWSVFRFVFDLLASELAGPDQDSHPCELGNDLLACLLNRSGPASETGRQAMMDTCRGIRTFMSRNHGVQLSVGIGSVVDRFRDVPISYEKARDALDYGIIREKSAVIDCAQIVDEAKEYFYPIDEELAIIKAVKSGDYESCARTLDRVFEENLQKRRLPLASIRCLLFDVVGTAIKTLDQIKINYVDAFGDFEPVEELIAVENVPETMDKIRRVFGQICSYLLERRSDHNLTLRNAIIRYIEDNYLDVNLSQTRTAEALGISVPYLSRFFKQETGVSMVEHINKLRLQQAKKLLLAGDMPLADLARAAGFGSDKTMIRLFKRHEGTTPGRFRESGGLLSILKRESN